MITKPWQELLEAKTGKDGQEAHAAHFEDLKKRYGGKIDAKITGAAAKEHRLRFERLMREWNPLDATQTQIEALAGKPTRVVEPGWLYFRFDDGTSVVEWVIARGFLMRRSGPFNGPDRLQKLEADTSKSEK